MKILINLMKYKYFTSDLITKPIPKVNDILRRFINKRMDKDTY